MVGWWAGVIVTAKNRAAEGRKDKVAVVSIMMIEAGGKAKRTSERPRTGLPTASRPCRRRITAH